MITAISGNVQVMDSNSTKNDEMNSQLIGGKKSMDAAALLPPRSPLSSPRKSPWGKSPSKQRISSLLMAGGNCGGGGARRFCGGLPTLQPLASGDEDDEDEGAVQQTEERNTDEKLPPPPPPQEKAPSPSIISGIKSPKPRGAIASPVGIRSDRISFPSRALPTASRRSSLASSMPKRNKRTEALTRSKSERGSANLHHRSKPVRDNSFKMIKQACAAAPPDSPLASRPKSLIRRLSSNRVVKRSASGQNAAVKLMTVSSGGGGGGSGSGSGSNDGMASTGSTTSSIKSLSREPPPSPSRKFKNSLRKLLARDPLSSQTDHIAAPPGNHYNTAKGGTSKSCHTMPDFCLESEHTETEDFAEASFSSLPLKAVDFRKAGTQGRNSPSPPSLLPVAPDLTPPTAPAKPSKSGEVKASSLLPHRTPPARKESGRKDRGQLPQAPLTAPEVAVKPKLTAGQLRKSLNEFRGALSNFSAARKGDTSGMTTEATGDSAPVMPGPRRSSMPLVGGGDPVVRANNSKEDGPATRGLPHRSRSMVNPTEKEKEALRSDSGDATKQHQPRSGETPRTRGAVRQTSDYALYANKRAPPKTTEDFLDAYENLIAAFEKSDAEFQPPRSPRAMGQVN